MQNEMRDRLMELIQQADAICGNRTQCEGCVGFGKGADCVDYHIADHLIENGVIVPPCKVGDKLYAISDTRIVECTCYDMNIGNKVTICASFKCDYDCEGCPFNNWVQEYTGEYSCKGEYGDWYLEEDDFGKTVFLTREEAEETLKEKQNESKT